MNDNRGDAGNWWRHALVYQIYPRSFADSNGDGVGDLQGIIARLDHLDRLGVDAVWLSPFYPSALVDGGYDIDDHRDVDPVFGTMADFDALVAELHRREIKLIVDIVPNHSSDRHRWFQEALSSPRGSAARDRYIFRDGSGPDGAEPPSDWSSFFGGPAWSRVADGQWYLHLFTREQPDWNWANAEVRADFLETLRFWSDHGADGFRVDVAHLAAKDLSDPLPSWSDLVGGKSYPEGQHPLWDRDDLDTIYRSWRELFDSYDPPRTAVAEAWVPAERRVRYSRADMLGQAFNFDLLKAPWDPAAFKSIIQDNIDLAERAGASSTWVFSNHDMVRHATRYGLPGDLDPARWLLDGGPAGSEDRGRGLRRARAATMLAMALPGSLYIYQGEELGLPEVGDLPDDVKQDPAFFRNRGSDPGRDGCRVPLPWESEGTSFGFGPNGSHLPQPAWFADYAVTTQRADPKSTLAFYEQAIRMRQTIAAAAPFTWTAAPDGVIAFTRGDGLTSFTNFGSAPADLPAGPILLSSGVLGDDRILPPDTTVWIGPAAGEPQ